jgi:hypothetical protein
MNNLLSFQEIFQIFIFYFNYKNIFLSVENIYIFYSMSFFDATAADDVTLHGLEKWTCHMFEQLGWMTLAYKSGRDDKVASYIVSINKLKSSLESRLKITTGEDAKMDLDRLLTKVSHLKKVTSKLFDSDKLKNSVCNKCHLPTKNGNEDEETDETRDMEQNNKSTKTKQDGGAKSRTHKQTSSKPKVIKSSHLMKKLSKISSKKGSKILSKKSSKKESKKESKKSSKKSNKVSQKKLQDQPLIKKLSKKSSKKNSKTATNKIFKKL